MNIHEALRVIHDNQNIAKVEITFDIDDDGNIFAKMEGLIARGFAQDGRDNFNFFYSQAPDLKTALIKFAEEISK